MSTAPIFRATPFTSFMLGGSAIPLIFISDAYLFTYFDGVLGLSVLVILACFLAPLFIKTRLHYRRFTIFLAPALLLKFFLGLELLRQLSLGQENSCGSLLSLSDPIVGEGMHLGLLALIAVVAVHLRSRSTSTKITHSQNLISGDWARAAHRDIKRDEEIGLPKAEVVQRQAKVDDLASLAEEIDVLGYFSRFDCLVSMLWLALGFVAAYVFDGALWGQIGGHNLTAGLIGALLSLIISTTLGVLVTRLIRECRDIRDTEVRELEEYFPSPESVIKATAGLSFEGVALTGFGLPPGSSVALQLIFQSVASAVSKTKKNKTWFPEEPEETESKPVSVLLELGEKIRAQLGLEPDSRVPWDRHVEKLSADLGVPLPCPTFAHNASLSPNEYRVNLDGVPLNKGELRFDLLMAVGSDSSLELVEGDLTWAPGSRFSAKWIDQDLADQAVELGCKILDPSSVLTEHILSILKDHAAKFLTRSELRSRLSKTRETHPRLVHALSKDEDRLLEVCRNLLMERVPIADFVAILKAVLEGTEIDENPAVLTEFTRSALPEQVSGPYRTASGKIHGLRLNSHLEGRLPTPENCTYLYKTYLLWTISSKMNVLYEEGIQPVLFASADIRFPLRQLTRELSDLVILSELDLEDDVELNILGEVNDDRWYSVQSRF